MSEPHRALALKWRPTKFDDVVGQPHVVRTLKNAIASGKVGHAYLFTGPRGVGKTTCARILARAVNCEKSGGSDPCGECVTCRDFLSGRALDLIEVDAASTRGIDEMRDLREIARLAPARARKKVFVLDEAHMLTPQASNALLKTLEEPPEHVLFILATTDAQDILPTIHSRCQRFDFHPLGPLTVATHLKKIAAAEGIEIEDSAVALIAKAARGAMRDAQMLMEQAAAYADGAVTAQQVRDLMGLVDREWVERFLVVLKDRDPQAGLKLVEDLIEAGREPAELLGEAQEELRDALMRRLDAKVATMATDGLLSAPERAGWFTEEELLALLGHVRRALDELAARQIRHPRIAAELAVARLIRRERPLSWAEVEEHLAKPGGGAPLAPVASRATILAPSGGTPANVPSGGAVVPLANLPGGWSAVLDAVKRSAPAAYVYLKSAACTGAGPGVIRLETASGFHRQGLAGGGMKAAVEAALSAVVGEPVRLEVSGAASPRPAPPPTAGPPPP
ncbi:MAG: DNA polymerase III subunit gamma/tau, partial [bacterium]